MMGVEWWFNDAVLDKHAAECQRLNIRTGQLRAEVNRLMTTTPRCPETIEVMLEMMRKCQTVDQACVSWAKGLPTDLQFKTVAWEDHVLQGDYSKAEVYPGRVDAYPDLWACSIWSMQRCSRIILASIIVRCAAWVCSPVDYRTTPEYATAARTCIDTITDIIASVPYQLGWFNNRKHLLEPFHLSAFGCGDEDVPKGLPGYFLTWPLSCVHGQDYASDSQRAWVRGRLEYIGNRLGVRYADLLAQVRSFHARPARPSTRLPPHFLSFHPLCLHCPDRAVSQAEILSPDQRPRSLYAHPPRRSHGESLPRCRQLRETPLVQAQRAAATWTYAAPAAAARGHVQGRS